MLCCGSSKITPEEENDINISRTLQRERKKTNAEYKLLLLGSGESGKSTFLKQIKILHKTGFQKEEILFFKNVIFYNILQSMKTLCLQAEILDITIEKPDLIEKFLQDSETFSKIDEEFGSQIEQLWALKGIKETMENYSYFQIIESAPYYFENIKRISKKQWIPSNEDILRSRAKTTGVIEIEFSVENSNFRLIDVGGQRSERKNWIHCFENVNAVLFLVAISEYNLTCMEDDKTNRLEESLKLFKEISTSKWFQNTSMILFLNKTDLFAEKIKKGDLSNFFPDFKGVSDYEKGLKWMEKKFRNVSNNNNNLEKKKDRQLYVHFTNATNTNQIQKVFQDCKKVVFSNVFSGTGVLN